jgi:5-methylcytosine-specific restriction enzyme subunit McrC
VIRCEPAGYDEWNLVVSDAIGLIVVGETVQLRVAPKIPTNHLLYLLQRSGTLPRLDIERGTAARGESFWDLVTEWFLRATERLLRRELSRDYQARVDEFLVPRGGLLPLPTASAYYTGRLRYTSEFDEVSVDTALNRIVRAATHAIVVSGHANDEVCRRARRILARMSDVGPLREGDVRARVERVTGHYRDAVMLAHCVLGSSGRTLDDGSEPTWTFLMRTPEPVEAGVRSVLREHLGTRVLNKISIRLAEVDLPLNPDLVFENPPAVADIKYKTTSSKWKRQDLYQVVAYAVALRCRHTAVIEFHDGRGVPPPAVCIGDISVTHFTWSSSPDVSPSEAAIRLSHDVESWLRRIEMGYDA